MNPEDFFEWIGPTAQLICPAYGLYPSVCMAQAAIESGWGEYIIGEYNLFGRKAVEGDRQTTLPTDEFIDGEWVVVDAPFKLYDSLEEAIEDYCVLLTYDGPDWENPYLPALEFISDKNKYIEEFSKVYATSPEYANSIKATIEANNLQEWD